MTRSAWSGLGQLLKNLNPFAKTLQKTNTTPPPLRQLREPRLAPNGAPLPLHENWFARGFDSDDFSDRRYTSRLDKIRKTDLHNDRIKLFPQEKHRSGTRKTMFRNLPWVLKGACPIKPNDNDLASQIDGVKHRVGGSPPPINRRTLRRFRYFCKNWIESNLTPLPADTDVTVQTWLKESPYTLERKEELQNIFDRYQEGYLSGRDVDFERLESFIKDEFYTCPKTFRTINSRVEIFKCLVGPTIHAVEKEVFKLDYFIKKVPVDQRARYITEVLDSNARIFGTDVSAWEGSMRKEIMEACEVPLFEYMTRNLPTGSEFISLYKQLLLNNKLCFSGFMAEIVSRRMSGEMSTSLGNGFTNLMIMLFTAFMMGVEIKLVVEGDDTLISCFCKLVNTYAQELGFNLIIEEFDGLNEASFCGLIFSDVKHTIRDPITTIMKFGWCTQQYLGANMSTRLQLLRAKALSLKCEMPNCPILGPFADRMIQLTNGICVKKSIKRLAQFLSLYKRNEFLDNIANYKEKWLVPAESTPESRVLMEKMFNIPADVQVLLEEDFAVMSLEAYSNPVMEVFVNDDNKIFWEYYVKDSPKALYEDVLNHTERVHPYQSWMPFNDPTDLRNQIPSYALRVAA